MKVLYWIALVLTVVGAANWGLVGLFNFNLVAYLFGSYPVIAQIIYIVVGAAGLYLLVVSLAKKSCCKSETAA